MPIAAETHSELVAVAVKVKVVAVLDVHAGKLDEAIATKFFVVVIAIKHVKVNRSMYILFQIYVCSLKMQ